MDLWEESTDFPTCLVPKNIFNSQAEPAMEVAESSVLPQYPVKSHFWWINWINPQMCRDKSMANEIL